MKPIIGIYANYSLNDNIGLKTGLGEMGQEWHLLADDYIASIERAGGIPLIIPLTENINTTFDLLNLLDGVLLTGGSDIDPQLYGELPRAGLQKINPRRDKHEFNFTKLILNNTRLPILGICRGMQMMNIVAGGSLYQDWNLEKSESFNHQLQNIPRHHPSHTVLIKRNSLFYGILSKRTIGVNSFNHQAIKRLGEGFKVSMTAPDDLIEGIELQKEDRFVCGLQWHPEMMIKHFPEYLKIFQTFIQYCSIKTKNKTF